MSNIHVALWNGLDQVYRVSESAVRSTGNLDSKTHDAFSTFGFQLKHAPFVVGPEEKSAFSQFASAVIHAIDTHHDLEEGEGFFSVEEDASSGRNRPSLTSSSPSPQSTTSHHW